MPFDPRTYWERRYAGGGDSGEGSRGPNATAKAAYLDALTEATPPISSVIDWGCGDGQVLEALEYSGAYVGVDLSTTIIERNRARFPGRRFEHADDIPDGRVAELAISSDVLHHFTDDADFLAYLDRVFGSASSAVAIFATDHDAGQTAFHCLWRHWTPIVAERYGDDWELDGGLQGRKTRPANFDPETPAWYLYRATRDLGPIEILPPPPDAGGYGLSYTDDQEQPSTVAMHSSGDLLPEDLQGKA